MLADNLSDSAVWRQRSVRARPAKPEVESRRSEACVVGPGFVAIVADACDTSLGGGASMLRSSESVSFSSRTCSRSPNASACAANAWNAAGCTRRMSATAAPPWLTAHPPVVPLLSPCAFQPAMRMQLPPRRRHGHGQAPSAAGAVACLSKHEFHRQGPLRHG